jgi:hypothetical protein
MLSALLVDDIGSQSALLDKVQLLSDTGSIAEILVVSTDERPSSMASVIWIKGASLVEALHEAVGIVASKRMIVISSALQLQSQDVSRLVAEIEASPMLQHLVIRPHCEQGELDLPDLTPQGIISSLTSMEHWPLMCVATTRMTLSEIKDSSASTCMELLAQALISALGDGDDVRVSSAISPYVSRSIARATSELPMRSRANLLQAAARAINIEELFPEHPWKEFSQESAAAAYHSLAALFLRFGDPEAAVQSLQCSERLEESPRFFALLGLIQQSQGETLGAVANFVSSLQCYEARKRNDGKHYLSFSPRNLEIINSNLVDGLNALNKRDNEQALSCFSDAVFNFDPFYEKHGIVTSRKND